MSILFVCYFFKYMQGMNGWIDYSTVLPSVHVKYIQIHEKSNIQMQTFQATQAFYLFK
jgi:hypothetical protein